MVDDGRLQGNNTTSYAYDPASNVATVSYANGVQSAVTYDALNRILGLAASSSAAEISGYAYQRGATGNLTSAAELNGCSINWSYDGIYRLTNEALASDPNNLNGSVAYSLDPVGNRLSDTSSLTGINSGSFGFNAHDEVSTETYDNNGNTLTTGGKSFTYDAAGNLTSLVHFNGVTTTYTFDALNRLLSRATPGETTVSFTYTAAAKRAQMINGSGTTSYTSITIYESALKDCQS